MERKVRTIIDVMNDLFSNRIIIHTDEARKGGVILVSGRELHNICKNVVSNKNPLKWLKSLTKIFEMVRKRVILESGRYGYDYFIRLSDVKDTILKLNPKSANLAHLSDKELSALGEIEYLDYHGLIQVPVVITSPLQVETAETTTNVDNTNDIGDIVHADGSKVSPSSFASSSSFANSLLTVNNKEVSYIESIEIKKDYFGKFVDDLVEKFKSDAIDKVNNLTSDLSRQSAKISGFFDNFETESKYAFNKNFADLLEQAKEQLKKEIVFELLPEISKYVVDEVSKATINLKLQSEVSVSSEKSKKPTSQVNVCSFDKVFTTYTDVPSGFESVIRFAEKNNLGFIINNGTVAKNFALIARKACELFNLPTYHVENKREGKRPIGCYQVELLQSIYNNSSVIKSWEREYVCGKWSKIEISPETAVKIAKKVVDQKLIQASSTSKIQPAQASMF